MVWKIVRFLVGLLLLPACWGITAALVAFISAHGLLGWSSLSFLGGVVLFVICWLTLPRLARTYVLGHELTHALWGLLFGARPSKLKVRRNGGSVNLTKSNLLITLAPYFFPFYTFLVILAAGIVRCCVSPLPCVPLWLFFIGFTWAFHVLFTVDSLSLSQPDVKEYGCVFAWPFIYIANLFFIFLGVSVAAAAEPADSLSLLGEHLLRAYSQCLHLVI